MSSPVVCQADRSTRWAGKQSIAVEAQSVTIESRALADLKRVGKEDAVRVKDGDRGATGEDNAFPIRCYQGGGNKAAQQRHIAISACVRIQEAEGAIAVGA